MSAPLGSALDQGASRPFVIGRDALPGLASWMRSTTLWGALAAFVLSAAGLAYVQFASPHLVDPDGYYHLRMAALVRQHGVPVAFPWLPLHDPRSGAFHGSPSPPARVAGAIHAPEQPGAGG